MKKKHGLENSYKKLRMGGMFYSKGGGADMSTKQKTIAAKAPPPNVLDGKDFAVLRAEKAKGRGKVMKARYGRSVKTDTEYAQKNKGEDRLTESDIKNAEKYLKGLNKGGKVMKAKSGKDVKFPKASGGKSSKEFLDYIKDLEDKPLVKAGS